LVAAEAAAGTVAAGSESLAEGAFGAQEHVGVATHVARDQDRLAEVAEPRRELRMPRGERPRGALAVHTEATRLPSHLVRLVFRDVVAHVVHEVRPLAGLAEYADQRAPCVVRHDLAV